MRRHVDNLTALYDELIEQRATQAQARPLLEKTG
jgi:hypothetical protein